MGGLYLLLSVEVGGERREGKGLLRKRGRKVKKKKRSLSHFVSFPLFSFASFRAFTYDGFSVVPEKEHEGLEAGAEEERLVYWRLKDVVAKSIGDNA